MPIGDEAAGRRAIDTARDLAARMDGKVRLVSVVSGSVALAAREELLHRLCAAEDMTDDCAVLVDDDIAGAIVDAAGNDAIVCMRTAGSLLPHHGHFGSIAEAVVRRLDRPVVLVGPNADPALDRDLRRVVLPVDGSDHSEAAVPPAADLAKLLGVPLWIVTVISQRDQRRAEAALGGAEAAESGYVAGLSREVRGDHGIDAEFEVLHIEDPADAILDFAEPDGIVVMSTHGRTGLARLFAGSVTTGVVAKAPHPVVVLHPGDHQLS